ncbi:MAG TPA: discoidin domain-containing protein, partial [Actinopolymorphaceae bacterium]|nr:discoidin domain-containing protein [Actinopolymorphaceae bacterium]
QTGAYMERAGLESVYILNRVNGTSVWMSPEETAAYIRDVDPSGVMFGWETCTDTRMLDGTLPQSVVRLNNTLDELQASIAEAARGWDGRSPLFLSMGVLAMRMTPTDVAAAAAALGPDYEVVRADEYFDLIRQADKRHPIDDDGVPDFAHVVPHADVTASATSFLAGFEPAKAVDGDATTFWHAATGPDHPLPQAITLDLGADYPVAALVYQPRQDVSCNGNITSYGVSVSTDGEAFTQVAAGQWRYDHHRKFTTWPPTAARFVRLEALEGFRGLASGAEITVAYEPDAEATLPPDAGASGPE